MSTTDAIGSPIRVLVVDDQALVRTGFRMILEIEPDLLVVGEAGDGVAALRQVESLRPDVVLMDVRMPVMDGIEATRRLVATPGNTTRVVMLTTFDLDEYVLSALQAGASGFVLKDVTPELLVAGIRSVYSGDALLAPTVTRRLIESYLDRPGDSPRTPGSAAALGSLTEREREVLTHLVRGMNNAEIARDLFISETTVKTHVSRILMKLNLRDRVHAIIWAYENGLQQRHPRR